MNLLDRLAAKYGQDYASMVQALDRAAAEIDRLRLDNAALRQENRHLRRVLHDHELRMLRRAERDALLIGALHFGGSATSRRVCAMVGLTENRWCLARALLRHGGAYDRRWRIKPATSDAFMECVQRGVAHVEKFGGAALRLGSYRHKGRT